MRAVSGGRVTLDFNHPLAGKALHYWAKVLRKVTDLKEKILFLAKMFGVENPEVLTMENRITIKGKELDKLEKEATAHIKGQIEKYVPEAKGKEVVFEKA